MIEILCFQCPLGFIKICGKDDYITEIKIIDEPVESTENATDEMKKCQKQLEEYFDGRRKEFDLNLKFEGTYFRKKVWQALLKVPYGKTAAYKDIAIAVNSPKAFRAVGSANHSNPIWIVVPCHRIIGSDGSLTGYGGGLWRKEKLLELERNNTY